MVKVRKVALDICELFVSILYFFVFTTTIPNNPNNTISTPQNASFI